MAALTVNLNPVIELTDEQFFQLCQANRDLRFERTATGELIIMLKGTHCAWIDINIGVEFEN